MKVFLGTDHAGFELKESLKAYLTEKGHEVIDCGATSFDPEDDYPDFCAEAARRVAETPDSRGIVFGKSGAGEAIVANKIQGIRAFLAMNEENIKLARLHNDANVMSLGSAFVSAQQAQTYTDIFLSTDFSHEERHQRRIDKIKKLEL